MTDDRRSEEERRRQIRVRDKRTQIDDEPRGSESEAERPGGTGASPDDPAVGTETMAGGADELRKEIQEANRLAEERYQQMLRLKADLENYRKRVIREQTELVDRASLRIVERLLPVLDDLERAMDAARSHAGAEGIVRGMELVYRHLLDVLRDEGLEKLEAEGAPFDPREHEATHSTPGDVPEPTVLEVVRPGYRLKGRTIRPALVHVTTPQESEEGGE